MLYLALLIVCVLVVIVVHFLRRPPLVSVPEDPVAKIHRLLREGIEYEEDFIVTYLQVIRDEGFMSAFGAHQDEARAMLTTLVDESKGHKAVLELAQKKIQ